MKARSPVLGYNHNVRYAGRTWHVQTEDSGVANPHIFTHLFHDGTIIGSKKTEYDAASEVTAVQKLMQGQHKLMMRELKSGAFDEKIVKFFGPIVRDPGDAEPKEAEAELKEVAAAPVAEAPVPPPPRPVAPMPMPAARPPNAPVAARPRVASLTPARPAVSVSARSNAPTPAVASRSVAPVPRTPPPTIGSGRSGVPQTARPTVENNVIVARPTVIVGKDSKKGETADFWKTTERRPEPQFGENLISEKSLDEVILAYLSEDAPKK